MCKFSKNLRKIRVYARLLVKISISQVFLDPIQNHLSARSADLEAPYLEALLYNFEFLFAICFSMYNMMARANLKLSSPIRCKERGEKTGFLTPAA